LFCSLPNPSVIFSPRRLWYSTCMYEDKKLTKLQIDDMRQESVLSHLSLLQSRGCRYITRNCPKRCYRYRYYKLDISLTSFCPGLCRFPESRGIEILDKLLLLQRHRNSLTSHTCKQKKDAIKGTVSQEYLADKYTQITELQGFI
jgi:hypothetical protein